MSHEVMRAFRRSTAWSSGIVLALVALAVRAPSSHAQTTAVTGIVVDSKSGRPIIEAAVAVENATGRARTPTCGVNSGSTA